MSILLYLCTQFSIVSHCSSHRSCHTRRSDPRRWIRLGHRHQPEKRRQYHLPLAQVYKLMIIQVYARQNADSCPSNLMRAYCDFNDPFCDSGLDITVHFSYNAKYKAKLSPLCDCLEKCSSCIGARNSNVTVCMRPAEIRREA